MREALIHTGMAAQAFPGEAECGDQCSVHFLPDGALVAVLDGLGHGPEAADAAHTAIRELAVRSEEPLTELALRCHRRLRGTRGAVMALASFSAAGTLAWLGVGTVQGVLVRAGGEPERHVFVCGRGIVGHGSLELLPSSLAVEKGDVLLVATDGVAGEFASERPLGPPSIVARRILSKHATLTDDALVLVARYLG